MICVAALLLLLASPAGADTVVAARTIRAQEIIGPADLALDEATVAGGLSDPAPLIGQEARTALYAGRPVRVADVGPPALVERNAIVPLVYHRDGLRITTEGRALDRAGEGEVIRVMNLASHATVTARLDAAGVATVSY